MPLSRRASRAATPLLALATFLPACGDDGAGPPTNGGNGDEGLAFTYSGDRSGSFQAAGTPPSAGQNLHGTWGAAVLLDTAVILVAARARAAPRVDLFALRVSDAITPGTYAFSTLDEGLGGLFFDVDPAALETDPVARRYALTAGTLTIRSIANGRIEGEFSLDGVLLETGSDRIFLRNGTFDVPLVEEPPISTSMVAGVR